MLDGALDSLESVGHLVLAGSAIKGIYRRLYGLCRYYVGFRGVYRDIQPI